MHSEIDTFFRPQGVLARAFRRHEWRPAQAEMAQRVGEVLQHGGILLAEAGTGVGKTLAYLVPALLSGQRVFVATGTRTLQSQIAENELPLLARILPVPVQWALLRGRANYLCRARLHAEWGQLIHDPHDRRILGEIVRWAETSRTGDRAELQDLPDDLPLWGRINCDDPLCEPAGCRFAPDCFLLRSRRQAAEVPLLILNHHLVFAELALRARSGAALLPQPDAFVFDEAHDLEDVACAFFGASAGSNELTRLLRDVRGLLANTGAHLGAEAERLQRAERIGGVFFEHFRSLAPGRHAFPGAGLSEPAERDAFALDGVLEGLEQVLASLAERAGQDGLRLAARRVRLFRDDLARATTSDGEGDVRFVERSGSGVRLRSAPVDGAAILAEHVLDQVRSVVFTSATLSTGGDFAFFRQRMGIDHEVAELSVPSPFDYARNVLLYLPTHLPNVDAGPAFTTAAAAEVVRILTWTRGRALVLFTSHANLDAVHALASRHALGFPLMKQGEAQRALLLQRLRDETHSCLFATASFWQGVDVVGPALSAVIIDRLPFARPADPLVQARLERLAERGGNPFRDYQLPEAALVLKQGFGRLIRSAADRGLVAVLDGRIVARPYGRHFIETLPPCPRTSEPTEAERFCSERLDS